VLTKSKSRHAEAANPWWLRIYSRTNGDDKYQGDAKEYIKAERKFIKVKLLNAFSHCFTWRELQQKLSGGQAPHRQARSHRT
jgi:hypothetical protein